MLHLGFSKNVGLMACGLLSGFFAVKCCSPHRMHADAVRYDANIHRRVPSKIVGVMGPGQISEDQYQEIERLGRLLAAQNWIVLCGGRDCGVMDAVSRGCYEADGTVIGVLPTKDKECMSKYVTIPILTGMGSARNNINVLSSDIVIGCYATGFGTLSEIALALKAQKPVVLFRCSRTCVQCIRETAGAELANTLIFEANTTDEVVQCVQRYFQKR